MNSDKNDKPTVRERVMNWLAILVLLSIGIVWPAAFANTTDASIDPADVRAGSLLLRTSGEGRVVEALRQSTRMRAQVTGNVARVRVTQTFENPGDEWVEGLYVFPLPAGAAVDELGRRSGACREPRDFELVWTPAMQPDTHADAFAERVGDETYALVMLMPPQMSAARAYRREVIFIIDTSGSMSGPSIEQARAALHLGVQRLAAGTRSTSSGSAAMPKVCFPRRSSQTPRRAHLRLDISTASSRTAAPK